MFIGHFGAAFAAKKIDSRPSLGTMFMASQFIDLLWPLFLILGIEHVKINPGNTAFTPLDFINYPFSHGFLSVLVWSVLFGLIYYFIKKNSKGALVLGALVTSHWLLDFITHRPDLPLLPWAEFKVGLGLWNSVAMTLILEVGMFATGIFIYTKMTTSKNKKGTYALWGLILLLSIIYISNVFGPPPPAEGPIAFVGLAQWLLVAWAYWIDRNRNVIELT